MQKEKLDTSLQIALEALQEGMNTNRDLLYGYDPESESFRVIIKYNGDIKKIEEWYPDTKVVLLFNQYAIVTTNARYLTEIARMPETEYMEKPKKLYYNLDFSKEISCISRVQKQNTLGNSISGRNLTGNGVYIGIVDSGIDIYHPAFQKDDGSTRIAWLWDQSAQAKENDQIAAEYGYGTEYDREAIDRILLQARENGNRKQTPALESLSGHGTSVAGIAAGNGAGSVGRKYRGVATESEILVVKLGRQDRDYAGSTEVMEGIDYVLRKALLMQKPIAINLSFGNNTGAHAGNSLFEDYIASLNGVWKNVIVIATGNEGDARHHSTIQMTERGESIEVPFVIGDQERNMTLWIWKEYFDTFQLELETPSGERIVLQQTITTGQIYDMGSSQVFFYAGDPSPYSTQQELYLEWLTGRNGFVPSGIWKLHFTPEEIKDGFVSIWMMTTEAIGLTSGFLYPEADSTLTNPSTSEKILSVGAYRADNDSMAAFSGRGNTADGRQAPILVAPGVDVVTAIPGGNYAARSGTSIAAPFVTGSAALLMEWGIVHGNDAYLYGEKVKAYLIKGARRLPGFTKWPNPQAGWGALCLYDSLPW